MRFAARVVGTIGALVASVTLFAAVSDAAVLGRQRTLVVLVAFGVPPYSRAVVTETMSSANTFLQRASYGRVSLQTTVTPWLDGGFPVPDCAASTEGMVAPLRTLAAAEGFDVANYDRVVYVVDEARCGFQGMALGHEVLIAREPDAQLIVHELGHTFGLPHEAAASRCGTWCVTQEEGDLYTVMGRGAADFSPYEKEALGWIPHQPRITRPGRYTLGAASPNNLTRQSLVLDTPNGEYWLQQRPGAPRPALIVRVVHPEYPTGGFAIPPSTLFLSPVRLGHPTITAGQTFRVDGAFSVTVTKGPAPLRMKLNLTDGYEQQAADTITP